MKKMIIYGHSDDCNEIGGEFCEEGYTDVAKITAPDGSGLYVIWSYSEKVHNGCWSIGFQQLDEYVPFPEWASNVKLKTYENEYSPQFEMWVPEDTKIEWIE